MKKGWIIGAIAILIVIILVLVFYSKPIEENNSYNTTKEEPITFISGWINNLEECQGHSKFSSREDALDAGYSEECLETTDIDNSNLNKLKSLENIKGISLDSDSITNYNFEECNILWELDYARISARVYHTVITIYDCESKFYLTTHTYPGDPTNIVYKINPSEEIILKLKE